MPFGDCRGGLSIIGAAFTSYDPVADADGRISSAALKVAGALAEATASRHALRLMAVDTQPDGPQDAVGLQWLWRAVALAFVYFVVAKLGLRYATIGPSISPVWPPTGLAIAALVILGLRYWPAVLVGAFLANATTPVPIIAAFGIGCGNATEAVLAAYLLRRRWGRR